MAKKKSGTSTKEKYLAKRREQKKLSMRRARERLKNDPEKYEDVKLKDRQRYKKYKEEGRIKVISEQTPREQRLTRKGWKERSKTYRLKQKNAQKLDDYLDECTPPESPNSIPLVGALQASCSRQMDSGKKLARKNREKKIKLIQELKEKLKKANKKAEKYKKRYNRIKKVNKYTDTPTKVVEKLLKGQINTYEVKRKLLFGEVISKQIRHNFKEQTEEKKKKLCASFFNGKIVEKYKFKQYLSSLTSRRALNNEKSYSKKKELGKELMCLRESVKRFLEQDENSRMTAGKKETITVKKIKKQRRYLTDSLKNLHLKFLKEHPNLVHLSYSLFCMLRPFWIMFPKVGARETCLCKTHANIEIIVKKLHFMGVIFENTPNDVIRNLCCSEELQPKCLQRKCSKCLSKTLTVNEFDTKEITSFDQWITKKVNIAVKGKEKQVQKTIKETITCTKEDVLVKLKKLITPFMTHTYNIKHQYKVIRNVKEDLSEFEALLHFDFSQNYSCKYSSEVQSFHFGGSRSQVTLHTSVLYYVDHCDKTLKLKSFCSLSESMRHDPAAICAHLEPVIAEMKELVPMLKKVHFLSDGPSTQYRNKKMFFLLGVHLTKIMRASEVVWHYSEAGHGKGAADGVGGSLKRTADGLVAKGNDIANFQQLVDQLENNVTDVKLFQIFESQIMKFDQLLPKEPLETFKGTTKVHQLTWDKESPNTIQARSLSCMNCASGKSCLHFNIGVIQLSHDKNTIQASENKPTKHRVEYQDVYSDSEEETEPAQVNDFVIVKFAGKKSIKHYVAIIESIDSEDYQVVFLKHAGKSSFSVPEGADKSVYDVQKSDVCEILPNPVSFRRNCYTFKFNFTKYNLC